MSKSKKPSGPIVGGLSPISEMSVEELLAELRKSQGPGDSFVEITSNGVRTTVGKKEKNTKK